MSEVWRVAAVWVLTLTVLSSCTTVNKAPPVDLAQHQARLEALTQFSFSGGLGVWTDEQSVSARVQWQQDENQLIVRLTGPLGIGNMELVSTAELATLSRAGKLIKKGRSVDQVLQAGLGLAAPVPIEQLKHWVVGMPGKGQSVVTDGQGRLSSLRFIDEQGTRWQARFLKYTDLDELEVPSLITASGGPYKVRLLLKNWLPVVSSIVPPDKESNTRLAIPTR